MRPVSVGAGCNAAAAMTTTGPAPEATTPRCIRHDPMREESCARLRTGCCTGRENIRCHPPAKACPGRAAGLSTDTSEDFLAGLRPARLADLIAADFPSRERKTRILPSRVTRAILLQTATCAVRKLNHIQRCPLLKLWQRTRSFAKRIALLRWGVSGTPKAAACLKRLVMPPMPI